MKPQSAKEKNTEKGPFSSFANIKFAHHQTESGKAS